MRNNFKANVQSLAKKQKGFTLVEIAIVLVIIGLLLGGVLKGQELIENAKLKAVKTDSDAIVAAIQGYQDRFRALPGDGADGTAGNALTTDGTITSAESLLANDGTWAVLREEGFMSGNGNTAPVNSFGGTTTIDWGTNGLILCQLGLSDEQMLLVDIRYDDAVNGGDDGADTGAINYVTAAGTALTAATSSVGAAVAQGALCISY